MKTKKHFKKAISTLMISALMISNLPSTTVEAADAYQLAIPYQFTYAGGFSEGLAPVMDENYKVGYIDTTGKLVIPYQFPQNDPGYNDFSDGLAAVMDENNKFGYIDTTGKLVIPYQFDSPSIFSDGLALVTTYSDFSSSYGFIDTTGKFVIPYQSKSIGSFHDGLALTYDDNHKYGYIDSTGKLAIPYQFEAALSFSEGLAPVMDKDNKWGYIDTTGKLVIPYQFDEALKFSEGLAAVRSAENGKYGFIDTTGKLVIPYEFYVNPNYGFSDGLAAVRQDGSTYGFIDTTGKLVIPYQFEAYADVSYLEFSNGLFPVSNDENYKYGYISSPYAKSTTTTPTKPVTPTPQPTVQPKVIFKGSPLNIKGDILTIDNRTYYPLRDLLDSVGATVEWDNATKTATGTLNGNTVKFTIDQEQYIANGQTVTMDGAKLLVNNGKTYIPIRYALEGLGFTVGWDGATSSITVN